MRELVKRILPLCSNYSIVTRFIEGIISCFSYFMFLFCTRDHYLYSCLSGSTILLLQHDRYTTWLLCIKSRIFPSLRKIGVWIRTGKPRSKCSYENTNERLLGDGGTTRTTVQNGNAKLDLFNTTVSFNLWNHLIGITLSKRSEHSPTYITFFLIGKFVAPKFGVLCAVNNENDGDTCISVKLGQQSKVICSCLLCNSITAVF